MKKLILVAALFISSIAIAEAKTLVDITVSCGYIVTMEYEDYHNIRDVIHDARVLEKALCEK